MPARLNQMRPLVRGAVVLLAFAVLCVPVGPAPGAPVAPVVRASALARAASATMLTVGGAATGRPIAPGFLGLSLEYWAIPAYAGSDPAALNPVFVQLIRNLSGGAPPVLRIGGDTTDGTWWPVAGATPPAGVTYALTPGWVDVTRALAARLDARLILGINLEADSPAVAATEANALVAGLGRRWIEALELGNEPELYGIFSWGGSGAPGRPAGYDFAEFDREFTDIAGALPGIPLAGPAVGAPGWFGHLAPFLAAQPRVRIATLHRYPLQLCYVFPGQPNYPTIRHLFSAWSTRRLALSVAAAVKVAHAHHVPLRVDEMNTISCGNVPSVAQSFASALWALDSLFEMASVGVDGVNIHTFQGADYALFTFGQVDGRWRATVAPEYYGLELFAQAAPAGSRLVMVSFHSGGGRQLKAWATRAPDGTLRVVVINEGHRSRLVLVRASGVTPSGTLATAALERLEAPSLGARAGVTLGGQSFGAATGSGLLAGRRRVTSVAPSAGDYAFAVPAGSAAMLTLAPR